MGLAETAQLLVNLVVKADTASMAKVNTSLGQTNTAALGLGKTVVALGGAAGFGLLTKGALEAEAAQGKFMSATGASRDEAKQFVSGMDSLAGSAGAVGKSFEDIAAVGTTVAQQFGTTGDKTTDLTGKILELAKVSGGDATDQANALGDTLSGMGLDASAAGAVMDNLVASNQQFGTSIGDSITALDNMTPALTALGLSLDDGQGLLNAFEQANVDAATASGDLTKAIKNLKPGQNIDDLIAQVGAIEDPVLRAQEATKLFGKSAGPDLAKVIQPGMKSLKDVELQAKDTGGALDGAASDMETSGDKIRGIFDKLSAGAREIGRDFGPAVTGIASIASLLSPLVSGVKDLLFKAGPQIAEAATATGLATGAAMAEGEAEGAGGAKAITSIGSRIAAMSIPLAAEGTTVGTAVGGAMAAGVTAGWLAAIGAGVGAVLFLPEIIAHLTGTDATSTMANAGKYMADTYAAGSSDEIKAKYGTTFVDATNAALASGMDNNAAANAGKLAADTYLLSAGDEIKDHAADDLREAMSQSGISTIFANDQALKNAGIVSATTYGDSAAVTLADLKGPFGAIVTGDWKHVGDVGGDAAHDAGDDSAKQFALGWEDGVPSIHQQWKDFLKDMNNSLDPAKEMAWLHGKMTSQKLADGLKSNDPIIHARAQAEYDALKTEWDGLYALGYRYGGDGAKGVADGIRNSTGNASDAAHDMMIKVNAQISKIITGIRINVNTSTSDPEGTGHGRGIPQRAAGGPVEAGKPYLVNEDTPNSEIFIPGTSGTIVPRDKFASRMGGGAGAMAITLINKVVVSSREIREADKHYSVMQGKPAGSF